MKTKLTRNRRRAFSFFESLVVQGVVLVLIAGVLLPNVRRTHRCGQRIRCASNLKNVALSFRIFATDNQGKFPMEVPMAEGGSLDFIHNGDVAPHYRALSNELSTPKLLLCPMEGRHEALAFTSLLSTNVSYFVGLNARESAPRMLLAGDRNITNGSAVVSNQLDLVRHRVPGWRFGPHTNSGHLAFADGSVGFGDSRWLWDAQRQSGAWTNRIVLPEP